MKVDSERQDLPPLRARGPEHGRGVRHQNEPHPEGTRRGGRVCERRGRAQSAQGLDASVARGREETRQAGRLHGKTQAVTRTLRLAAFATLALALLLLTGCGGKKHNTARQIPTPPPTIRADSSRTTTYPERKTSPHPNEKILYTETGLASWYGPPYH